MKSKWKISLILFILVVGITVGTIVYGQDKDKGIDEARINASVEEPVITTKLLEKDGTEKLATKALYRVVVDTFEEAGEWYAVMPNDQGLITSRRQLGVPKALKKTGEEKQVNLPIPKFRKEDGTYQEKYQLPYTDKRKYVLGVRVDFQKRGNNWFAVYPFRPIKLEGVVKSFEIWVSGRQKNHTLAIIIEDIYGDQKIIPMGKLNFLGWKRMFVHVPDQVTQFDYKISTKRGITFKGFLIRCSPLESWGKYYIYFDNLTAEVSRFWEEYHDDRDPMDVW